MHWAGFDITIFSPDIDESQLENENPIDLVERLATNKIRVAPPASLTLAADTIVHRKGIIYCKPVDAEEAYTHLRALSGNTHTVTTGVAVRVGTTIHTFHVNTDVRIRTLTDQEIQAYIESGEPFGKAGGYAIQGRGGALVAGIHGSWTNVMGLPMSETLSTIERLSS
jgi:septum formation protein